MDPILEAIDEALKRRGLSDAAASKLAVGNYALIKNMRSSRSEDKRYNFQALEKLAEVLGLECYFGPPRDTGPIESVLVGGDDYAHIPLHEASLAAGNGSQNDTEEVVDFLAFRRDWLRKIGVSASNAVLARAYGESMQPTIWADDMVLIDRSRIEVPVRTPGTKGARRSPIYAIVEEGKARIKRLERPEPGLIMMLSDNPDYSPEIAKIETLSVIGKVMWWGHTNRE